MKKFFFHKIQSIKYLPIFAAAIVILSLTASCAKKKAPELASISINTNPDSATVIYKGKEVGKTPFEIKVNAGTYIFELEKINYKPAFVKISVAQGEKRSIELNLEEIAASVMIESNPQGAIIEIDGKEIGQTPMILHGQTIGTHKAILKKPGMVAQEISWTIEDARPKSVRASLFSNMGVLKINVTPSNAQINIDGKSKGKSPFTESIEQGEHLLEIEAPGYEKHVQQIVVEREKENNYNIALNVLPATINVNSQPEGADIFINDKLVGKAPVSISGLQPGKYQIRAEKKGFDPSSKEVEVGPGGNAEITLTLDTNLGGIDLVASPPGVTVYLNGNKIGKIEPSEDRKTAKIFEIRGLTHGNHTIRLSHARAIPQDQEFTVKVEKGQITRTKAYKIWIADTTVKFKNGKTITGRMREKTDKKIFFEPEPGIGISYDMEEILELIPLKQEEE